MNILGYVVRKSDSHLSQYEIFLDGWKIGHLISIQGHFSAQFQNEEGEYIFFYDNADGDEDFSTKKETELIVEAVKIIHNRVLRRKILRRYKERVGSKIIDAYLCWSGGRGGDGYMEVKKNGQESFRMKAHFEREYTPYIPMSFGDAIEAVKNGKKVTRLEWGDERICVFCLNGSPETHIKGPWLYLLKATPKMACEVWEPCGREIMADDWMVIE